MGKRTPRGIRTRIRTTTYPGKKEKAGGVSPGLPHIEYCGWAGDYSTLFLCPTNALRNEGGQIILDYASCVHCFRCSRNFPGLIEWDPGYEWASILQAHDESSHNRKKAFDRSLRILVTDGGACGACVNEIEQISKPHYNIQRLGFCLTSEPDEADILMVAGPITKDHVLSIQKAYEATKLPKRVLAIGSCSLSGGIFGSSLMDISGIRELIPEDIGVPGCPPPPLAIMHGLLLAAYRRTSTSFGFLKSSGGRKASKT